MDKIEKLLKELESVQKKLAQALPEAISKARLEAATAESMVARLEAMKTMLPEQETREVAAKTAKRKATKVRAIGQQMVAIRKKASMSQKDAAKKAKVSQPTLCNIEQGKQKPSHETAEKLHKAFPELKLDPSEFGPN